MPARMSFALPNREKPKQGSVGIAVSFDFTTLGQISSDLVLEQATGALDFVQSIFIDNRLNTKSFTIAFQGLNYTIQVRPGRQGIWPVICSQGSLQFTAVSVGAGLVVPTIMFNEVLPYFFWDV